MKNTYSMQKRIEAAVGFEPTIKGFADLRFNHSATQPPQNKNSTYVKEPVQRYILFLKIANF